MCRPSELQVRLDPRTARTGERWKRQGSRQVEGRPQDPCPGERHRSRAPGPRLIPVRVEGDERGTVCLRLDTGSLEQ